MWSKQVTPAILYFCAAGPWWSWNLLWPRTIVPVPPVCWVQGGRSGYPELGSILQVTQITNKNQPFRYADTCWICVPCPIFIMGWHACTWWLYFYCWLKSLLRLLMMTLLNCKEHSVFHFGLTCGTWVVTSRGSTLRHFLAPMGLLSAPSVKAANLMVARSGFRSLDTCMFAHEDYILFFVYRSFHMIQVCYVGATHPR